MDRIDSYLPFALLPVQPRKSDRETVSYGSRVGAFLCEWFRRQGKIEKNQTASF